MKRPRVSSRAVRLPAIGLFLCAAMLWLSQARVTDAECPGIDPWPSFAQAAQNGKTVVVGEVIESLRESPVGLAVGFRFRVDEVLRGQAGGLITFEGMTPGEGILCPHASLLRPRVGDVLAISSNDVLPTVENGYPFGSDKLRPDVAVAFIRGQPSLDFMPGMRVLTLEKVRLLALPETDSLITSGPTQSAARFDLWATVVAFGLLVIVMRSFDGRRSEAEARRGG